MFAAHQLAVRVTTLFLPRSATVRYLEGFRYSGVVFSAERFVRSAGDRTGMPVTLVVSPPSGK